MSQAVLPEPPATARSQEIPYEIVYGEYRELEPMSASEVRLAFKLGVWLENFGEQQDLGGAVTEMLFVLDAERNLQRRPDVAFVRWDRWPARSVPRTTAWNVVPDLAVEVVSPTNLADEIDERVTEFFAAGVRLVWVIYPRTGKVYVFTSLHDCRVFQRTDVLDGGDVLPGFRLPIDEFFKSVNVTEN